MRKYDTTFIIGGSLGVEEREVLIEKFKSALEKVGGKVERIVRWGMRTLAYAIKKSSQGYYVIFYYEADPSVVKLFERELRINENVLRYMTLVFEGTHPDYIPDEEIRRSGVTHTSITPAISSEKEIPAVEAEAFQLQEEDEKVVELPEEEIVSDIEEDITEASEEETEDETDNEEKEDEN